jgi:hypothetical protein
MMPYFIIFFVSTLLFLIVKSLWAFFQMKQIENQYKQKREEIIYQIFESLSFLEGLLVTFDDKNIHKKASSFLLQKKHFEEKASILYNAHILYGLALEIQNFTEHVQLNPKTQKEKTYNAAYEKTRPLFTLRLQKAEKMIQIFKRYGTLRLLYKKTFFGFFSTL